MNLDSPQALAVLHTVASIPPGRLSTYGDIAKAAGLPGNARFVGQVLKNLPRGSDIPWYRVINSQGKISFPKDSRPYERQINKLVDEGHPETLSISRLREMRWP